MLTLKLLGVLSTGFFLGIRHSFEPDHVSAISAIVSKGGSLRRAAIVGVVWGAGHTLTLLVVTALTLGLRITIPPGLSVFFELAAGAMLTVLGLLILKSIFFDHWRGDAVLPQAGAAIETASGMEHHKPFLIGLLHGLAGSASILILIIAGMSSLTHGLMFSFTFGLGSMAGMALAGVLIALPFLFASGRRWLHPALMLLPAFVSVAIGLNMLRVNWVLP